MRPAQPLKIFLTHVSIISILQWAALVAPLVTLPILTNNLGLDGYGQLAIFVSLTCYLNIFIDFGLSKSAARQIALAHDEKNEYEIIRKIQSAKLLLTIFSYIIFVFVTSILINNDNLKIVFFIGGGIYAASNYLYPIWYLEGTNRLMGATIYQSAGKVIQVILTIGLIHSPSSLKSAIIIESITNIIPMIFSFRYISLNRLIVFNSLNNTLRELHLALPFFITALSTSIFTTMNPILLSLFTNHETVGIYAIADRLMEASKRFIAPILLPMYTRWIKILNTKPSEFLKELTYLSIVLALYGAGVFLLFLIFGNDIVLLLNNQSAPLVNTTLSILGIVPLLSIISHIAGYQVMIPHHLEKIHAKIFSLSALIGLIISIKLIGDFGAIGMAASVVLTESAIAAMTVYFAFHIIKLSLKSKKNDT